MLKKLFKQPKQKLLPIINLVLIILIIAGGVFYLVKDRKESLASINQQLAQLNKQLTSLKMETVKNIGERVSDLREEVKDLKKQADEIDIRTDYAIDPETGWKVYQDKENRFEIKYPSDLELSKRDARIRTESGDIRGESYRFQKYNRLYDGSSRPNNFIFLDMNVYPNKDFSDIDSLIQWKEEQMDPSYKELIIKKEKIEIAELETFHIKSYSFFNKNIIYHSFYFIEPQRNKFYIMSFVAPNSKIFDIIVNNITESICFVF